MTAIVLFTVKKKNLRRAFVSAGARLRVCRKSRHHCGRDTAGPAEGGGQRESKVSPGYTDSL